MWTEGVISTELPKKEEREENFPVLSYFVIILAGWFYKFKEIDIKK